MCFGGGGGSSGVDTEYNARMATIAEEMQGFAKEYFDFWESDYKPFEAEQIAANRTLIPAQTALAGQQIESESKLLPTSTDLALEEIASRRELLPGETGLKGEQISAQRELLPGETALRGEQITSERKLLPSSTDLAMEQIASRRELLPGQTALAGQAMGSISDELRYAAPVTKKFYEEAEKGVDVNRRIGEARADVTQAYSKGKAMQDRDLSRMGINPASGAYRSANRDLALGTSKALAGATTTARNRAEDENWQRLNTAMGAKGGSAGALAGLTRL